MTDTTGSEAEARSIEGTATGGTASEPTAGTGGAERAVDAVLEHFERWIADFARVTDRARERFLARDWHAAQRDAVERLTLHTIAVDDCVDELRGRVSGREMEDGRDRFAAAVAGRPDAELARTFFSSVARRVLGTVGVDPRTEFTPADGDGAPSPAPFRAYTTCGVDAALFRTVFRDTGLSHAFAGLDADAERCARAARAQLGDEAGRATAAEVLPALFYRNKAAYLVGRLRIEGGGVRPLVVPLLHPPEGVRPDAVLTDADEVHVVFSFARSYFHVATDRPGGVVDFLRTLMPAKPIHELYSGIGHNKHGKTVLYRELLRQLGEPGARFEPAEGARGLVMSVFILADANVVFKVIRDRFVPPKQGSRERVMEKYRLVFALDRVGRLVDAQEFENLAFPRDRFAPEVLRELEESAAESLRVEGDRVVVRHLYTERRLRPLDRYLREAEPDAARAAVVEYGNAIRDLACANIFPGDLLLKNFGVSRHGRVIFYDYDELSLLTDVRFRSLPTPRSDEDEMSAEAWFSVDERDVFPEEFLPFLVPAGPLRDAFLDAHADLLKPAYWRDLQRRQKDGELPDFYPYPQSRRLKAMRD